MQLWQLGLLVVGGVSLIVYLVHAAGGSRRALLADDKAAIDRFHEDYPEVTPVKTHLTKSQDAAFLALLDGSIGLIHPVGDCFLTRVLTAADICSFTTNATSLTLKITDFGFKGGTYEFTSEAERQAVQTLLDKMGATHA